MKGTELAFVKFVTVVLRRVLTTHYPANLATLYGGSCPFRCCP